MFCEAEVGGAMGSKSGEGVAPPSQTKDMQVFIFADRNTEKRPSHRKTSRKDRLRNTVLQVPTPSRGDSYNAG